MPRLHLLLEYLHWHWRQSKSWIIQVPQTGFSLCSNWVSFKAVPCACLCPQSILHVSIPYYLHGHAPINVLFTSLSRFITFLSLQSQPDLAWHAISCRLHFQSLVPQRPQLANQWGGAKSQPQVWLWSHWCSCHCEQGSQLDICTDSAELYHRCWA